MSQTKSQLFDTSVNGISALETGAHDATLDASGNLNIGTGNVIVASGKGIDFSATSGSGTSELLADYEEGTFSPTVTAGYTSVSYAHQSGWYTKCGRTVVISGRVQFSGTANAAQITLGGLPFAQSAVGSTYGGGGIPYATVPEVTGTSPYVSASSSVVFYTTGTGGNVTSSSNISSKWVSFVVSIATA